MPDLSTVAGAVNAVAATASRQITAKELDYLVADMLKHPRDYGAWAGPNWETRTLRSEIAQRLWNLPCHPSEVPEGYRGLPFKILRSLLVHELTPEMVSGHTLEPAEAEEWLKSCACNRRQRGEEWKIWLSNPLRWRFRHVPDAAFLRLMEWEGKSQAF